MLLRARKFERVPPSRDAKCIFVFCEGARTEAKYFNYFVGLDSRLNIVVHKHDEAENNSPMGLYSTAIAKVLEGKGEKEFREGDEVWIICDWDSDRDNSRDGQFRTILGECSARPGWHLAISNPCFEVWLLYHLLNDLSAYAHLATCREWKPLVNTQISGGFNPSRHPVNIGIATQNAMRSYAEHDNLPSIGSSQVFRVGESILNLIGGKIEKLKSRI
jgi:hypothetical protein